MTPLDLIRPPLVDEQSIPRARVFVAKHNAILRRHTVSKCWCAAMCA